ncbi:MAG: DUF2330 domain-containing protein [Gemmataceae bacterium]|nr:DUF2330 domain-containing protein [Gemmataceae bacterium]MDW8266805.1 DUF2330 domain-containing protein [Gemmataceae bacterium]
MPKMRLCPWLAAGLVAAVCIGVSPPPADSACCYFSAKEKDVLQPGQKVFITWDPAAKVESFTVQPKFEGNALDFGMVIPTPSRPKLDEMPRDFFKELAVFTILKQRKFPESKLLPRPLFASPAKAGIAGDGQILRDRGSTVRVLESGVVGSLDYKIITAERADDLYTWLKENKYHYAGDEATLDFYVQKKWFFTVMKIDTMQMKRAPDGSYVGEVTPTRFRFTSDTLIYPLKITQISVRDQTEALFYVQAPYKVDLPGDMTYQYQWIPMLQNARGWYNKGTFGSDDLPGKADQWLRAAEPAIPALLQRGQQLGFGFVSGQRPQPNRQGRIATTLEWAKKLTSDDIKLLKGEAPFSETLPDPDQGFTEADIRDPKKAEAVFKVINERLEKYMKERPAGYLVRSAPEADIKQLKLLLGHLQEGQFVTKFRKIFTKDEMNDDLLIVPAKIGNAEDWSEYEEILPTSPP